MGRSVRAVRSAFSSASELFTGGTALIGGVLLAIAPDGPLLAADPTALHGNPFANYRLPGLLLAALVGGGYLLTGWRQRRAGRGARALSVFAGACLVMFEGAEVLWLGFQPLEAVFAPSGNSCRAGADRRARTRSASMTGRIVPTPQREIAR